MDSIDKIYDLLDNIEVTRENSREIENIKNIISKGDYLEALKRMRKLKDIEENAKQNQEEVLDVSSQEDEEGKYPDELSNPELEQDFIGILLDNPKLISKYYFIFDDCIFEDDAMLKYII